MYWKRVPDPDSNTVEITIESAWRRSYSSNYFALAQNPTSDVVMRINGRVSPMVTFGDGQMQYLEEVRIKAYSVAEDWFLGVEVLTHTYATPSNAGSPWLVHFTGCCQLRTLENAKDSSWDLWTAIDLLQSDESPRIVSLPVIHVPVNTLTSFFLETAGGPAAQLAAVTWSPAGAPGTPAAPPQGVAVGAEGTIVALLGCPDGTRPFCLYALQAYAAVGSAQVPVALIINVTQSSVPKPAFDPTSVPANNWLLSLNPGFEKALDIRGYLTSQPAAGGAAISVGFTVGPLPVGARLSTVRGKGTSADAPAVITLRWNPTSAQMGVDIGCFDVVNSLGVACTQKCISLEVKPDVGPSLAFALDGQALALQARPPTECPVSPCYYAKLFIGGQHVLDISATDPNALDSVTIDPVPPPPA
eukprot:CAMPEP_0172165236 /NCGR_PEP_ID=MMETSP1050-20130122/8301_1 /TAXON_ID=233186 /ORGANISM="Cryptomonas curvata, Strain CCAP979/52" /LENGTH=415 /DNA_ID=CAMNT_0012835687 /DNA_START=166 /DNA_END=1409 /DNA_ORIENTATION=+